MAFTTPILKSIVPFTSIQNYEYSFTYIPGDQFTHINFIISTNEESPVVAYQFSGGFYQTYCLIPANTLTNGVEYQIKVRVGDGTTWSQFSLAKAFWCLSNPVVSVENIDDGIIKNQTYVFSGSYSQSQNEPIRSYRFFLRDDTGTIIKSSSETYITETPYVIEFEVTGFPNDADFSIELVCTTQKGMVATSGVQPFIVRYIQPVMYTEFQITNNKDTGEVRLASLVRQITASAEGSYSFSDGEWVDLTADGAKVIFDERMDMVGKNYFLQMWMKGISEGTPFFEINGTRGIIEVYYEDNRFYAKKNSVDGISSLYVSGEDITIESSTVFSLIFVLIDDSIDLKAEIVI